MSFFKQLENQTGSIDISVEQILQELKFNDQGLIPAIAQQYDSQEVLMMAWMNLESIRETLQTGQVCYWSRSRQMLWRKGESSGQIQRLKQMHLDCDGDTLLLTVDQTGPACHTGRKSCFFFRLQDNQVLIDSEVLIPPTTLYSEK